MLRKTIIAGMVAALPLTSPALALSPAEAAIKLATIESEFTNCWRARVLTAVIVVQYLRDCMGKPRGDVRDLRGKLNKGISSLGSDNPERSEMLNVRIDVDQMRTFLNALDGSLKYLGKQTDADGADRTLQGACKRMRADPHFGSRAPGGPSTYKFHLTLCYQM